MHKLKLIPASLALLMCFCIPVHAQTPAPTAELVGQFGEGVYTFSWSPDGASMVTGTVGIGWDLGCGRRSDKPPVVQIWSVGWVDGAWSATLTDTLEGFERHISWVGWSPDGTKIAILETGTRLLIWDVQQRAYTAEIAPYNYGFLIHWHPNSEWVVVAVHQVHFIDTQTGQVIDSFPLPSEYEPVTDNPWWIHDAQVNPTGNLLAMITPQRNDNYKFVIWDLVTGKELLIIDHVGYDMAWSPDGRYLATYTGVFDALTGEKVIDSSSYTFGFLYPSWSFDGAYLATGDFIFDVAAGEPLKLPDDLVGLGCIETAWNPREYVVACLKFDRTIDVWGIRDRA